MRLNPYLSFKGQCEEAFAFYARCLGAEIVAMVRYGDTPLLEDGRAPDDMQNCGGKLPAHWRDKIAHARLIVGGTVLMGSDSPPAYQEDTKGFEVTVNVEDPAEAERIFGTLAEGGTVRMPLQETFWAVRFGMLVDRFGIPWMVNCEKTPA